MLFWFCCNCFWSWHTSVCSPQCCKHSQAGFLNLAVCDLVWKPCHIPEWFGHHHCHSGGTSLHQGQRTWQTLARNEGDLPQRCSEQGNCGSDALMLALLSYDLAKFITIVSVWIKKIVPLLGEPPWTYKHRVWLLLTLTSKLDYYLAYLQSIWARERIVLSWTVLFKV